MLFAKKQLPLLMRRECKSRLLEIGTRNNLQMRRLYMRPWAPTRPRRKTPLPPNRISNIRTLSDEYRTMLMPKPNLLAKEHGNRRSKLAGPLVGLNQASRFQQWQTSHWCLTAAMRQGWCISGRCPTLASTRRDCPGQAR